MLVRKNTDTKRDNMTNWKDLQEGMERQKIYSQFFFDEKNLSQYEKEELTKTFILSLHAEASELVSSINLKNHRSVRNKVDLNKILFKSVDVFRYILANLNLWNISVEQFVDACEDKDLFLHSRHKISLKVREGKRVIVFDVDDVIAEFRSSYNNFLYENFDIISDPHNKQYYNVDEMIKRKIDPDFVFNLFVSKGGFKKLEVCKNIVEALQSLREKGFWIHLLTARPDENLKCFYDTFAWLELNQIPFDDISFSKEKYLWLTGQDFFQKNEVYCAVDDSSKHADEYAKHGIKVIVPARHYNEDIKDRNNIYRFEFESPEKIVEKVLALN